MLYPNKELKFIFDTFKYIESACFRLMVRMRGLEPPHLAAPDPKTDLNDLSINIKNY